MAEETLGSLEAAIHAEADRELEQNIKARLQGLRLAVVGLTSEFGEPKETPEIFFRHPTPGIRVRLDQAFEELIADSLFEAFRDVVRASHARRFVEEVAELKKRKAIV